MRVPVVATQVWLCLGIFFLSTCLRLGQMEQLSLDHAQVGYNSSSQLGLVQTLPTFLRPCTTHS